ncbi:restriction endonuclease subunit S [Spirochaetota bacterium]
MNKPYPKYKQSGVEWLVEVPEHWSKFRISDLARYGKKTFIDGDWIESPYITDEGVRLLQTGNVGIGKYKEQGYRYISEVTFKELDCTEINPGDVLICRLADPVGRACIAPKLNDRMITSVDVAILKPRSQHLNKYIVYALSSDEYLNYLAMLCRGGTRDRVSRSMLGQIRILLPPLPEQQAIASFLDRETTKIDALIAKQERLLELLAEQRSALISRAVTKGLDASVKLKPSGVEWLGEVPEHWEVWKLAHGFDFVGSGTTPPSDELEWYDGTTPWITTSELRENLITNTDKCVSKEAISRFSALKIFPKGSLAIAMYGATIGRLGILGIEATTNQACCVMHGGQMFSINFVYFWMQAFKESIILLASGGGQPNISQDKIKSLKIPCPSVQEQQSIASFLDRETSKIDALSSKVATVIDKLKEYRTALISSTVSGKIDVREAV